MARPDTTEAWLLEQSIISIVGDAICEGAYEWDAYAVPATKEPAEKAARLILDLLRKAS